MNIICKLGVLAMLVTSSFAAQAQTETTWGFDDKTISLQESSFDRITVLDHRKDTTAAIGTNTRMFGKTVAFRPTGSISSLFVSYPLSGVPAAARENQELLLVLRDFWIAENVKDLGVTAQTIAGDLFISDGPDSYVLVATVDTLVEFVQKKRTPRHDVMDVIMANAMRYHPAEAERRYTREEAIGYYDAARKNFPAFSGAPFPKGVYLSVSAFLSQKPVAGDFKQLDHFPGGTGANRPEFKLAPSAEHPGGKLSHKEFFAVNNGSRWYVAHRDGAIAANWDGSDMYVGMPQRGLVGGQQAAATGMVLFGALGGLLAYADTHKGMGSDASYLFRFNPLSQTFRPIRRLD